MQSAGASQSAREQNISGCRLYMCRSCRLDLAPLATAVCVAEGQTHSPHSFLETLILETWNGQSSIRLVTFFWPALAAVVLKPKQVIKGARTIISEICVRESEREYGLLENWYCHQPHLIVPLLTKSHDWVYRGLPLQVIINLIAAHSLILFLALHMFTFGP